MFHSVRNAYIKLTLAIISWAGVYQAANYLVKNLDPYTTAFIRYFIASIILLVIQRIRRGEFIDKEVFKANWGILITIGVIGIGLYNIAFFGAEKYLSAQMLVLIFSCTPCLTTLLASLVFKQHVGWLGYVGMLIALAGTVGVINYGSPSCGQYFCPDIFEHLSIGEVYALFLCLFCAIFNLLNKAASGRGIDSLTITTYAAVFGTILLFFTMLIWGDFSNLWQQIFNFWLALLYSSVIASVIAYFWYSEAIRVLGVAKTVVFVNAIPFLTILIGVVLFNQSISLPIVLCGVVIVGGVLITNFVINRSK